VTAADVTPADGPQDRNNAADDASPAVAAADVATVDRTTEQNQEEVERMRQPRSAHR
jgi:hypothetical protein